MRNLLLISQDIATFSTRHPLDRIVLPTDLIPHHDHLPKGHIWWVERHRRYLHLRARLCVIQASLERELKYATRRLVWHLDPIHSERITWPGTRQRGKGNVTNLLDELELPSGLTLVPIPTSLNQQLEVRRLAVSESAWRFKHAAQIMRKKFDRTKRYIPAAGSNPLSLEQAWYFVHTYFAREELVSVPGYDAYTVAAAVLAGYTELPVEQSMSPEILETLVESETTCFRELVEEHIGYVERQWTRDTGVIGHLVAVERQTRRHQQILRALTRQLYAMGFQPTYNRHVDLCIERQEDQVFFEIKTANSDNIIEQVRRAVGQLLEYRFRYQKQNDAKPVRLAALIEANASPSILKFVRAFLSEVDIALVLWKENLCLFEGLVEVLG